jgi:endonuclease YncB( thermonuclease family)
VDVRLGTGPKVRVRLVGIDTPEVYGGKECGGEAASRAAKKLLPKGTPVLLVSDPTQDLRDRYGRLLRYVMKQGTDVNRLQVNRGHATVYVYAHHPFQRTKSYRHAQAHAKRLDAGIWKSCR